MRQLKRVSQLVWRDSQLSSAARAWPIWAAGFQSITVLVHIVTMIDLRIRAIAYISAYTIGSYGVLICVAIGAWQAWRLRQLVRSPEDGVL